MSTPTPGVDAFARALYEAQYPSGRPWYQMHKSTRTRFRRLAERLLESPFLRQTICELRTAKSTAPVSPPPSEPQGGSGP